MIAIDSGRIGTLLHIPRLRIARRTSVAVLAPNGAGKSTLLAGLAGVLPIDGRATVPAAVSYLPEGFRPDPSISASALLRLAASLPGWESDAAEDLARRLPVPGRVAVGRLSLGQRVRLGLRIALSRRLDWYLLDDPLLALDPEARAGAERWIARRTEDASIVLATPEASVARRLCTHTVRIDGGTVSDCVPLTEGP